MAVIWQKRISDKLYEVRSAGRTRRLYTNGVLHSQFNPGDVITGSVWDLLMLPAFFYPPQEIRSVLVLGVGGGAVFHQLNAFVHPAKMVGVELDGQHIRVAKRFFDLKYKNLTLYEADAYEWIESYSGPPFDMIIDDLFCDGDGDGHRVIPLDKHWFKLLNKHLSKSGVLVVNFESPKEMRESAYFKESSIKRLVCDAYHLETKYCENAVGVFLSKQVPIREFKRRISDAPDLAKSLRQDKLKFQVKRI